MPNIIRIARCCALAALLLLTAAAPHRRYPASAVRAEGLGLSLAGPCVAFAWHNIDERRATLFDLGQQGITATPEYGVRRDTVGVCPSPQPFSLGIGLTAGPMIAFERTDYFIAAGYHVSLGAWRIGVGAGVVYEPLPTRKRRAVTTVHVGNLFPFVGFQVGVRF